MKKTSIILLISFILFIGIINVHAKSNVQYLANNTVSNTTSITSCDTLLGDPSKEGSVAYYLQTILDVMKYLGIGLCIVLTIVDFFKALLGDDKDMLKSLSNKAFQRLIYAVMLFFLPIIVKFILTLIDVYGTCGIS